MVNVVLPGLVGVTATLVLVKVPSALSVAEVAAKLTVPVYPPVDVTVIVEVPLLPGFGDEMVMLVAAIVMFGLVTVTVVVPEEPEYDESPP